MTDTPQHKSTIQQRFDAIVAEIAEMQIRERHVCEVEHRNGDTISVMHGAEIVARIDLAGIGCVAEARTRPDASARIALWRNLRLDFIGWMERRTNGAEASA